MDELKYKALELGASDLGLSQMKNKKYYVIYNVSVGTYALKK
jgi:hypothetical protein